LNKEGQADVGFGSSQTQMIKNIFTVAPTLAKLLGNMAHNGLVIWSGRSDSKSDLILLVIACYFI
jgi:hypothetical protein